MKQKPQPRRLTSLLALLVISSLAIGGLLVGAQSAYADGAGNSDTAENGCMSEVRGAGPINCTANDIQLSTATNIVIDDPCEVVQPGDPVDTVTFTADFTVILTAQARHDLGIWFSNDGDPNNDAAESGSCTVSTPAYGPDPPFLDLDGTGDTFPDTNVVSNIQDTCGDIDDAHNPLFPRITLTVQCIDPDGDGKLNLPYCTSWKQPGDNDLCTGPLPDPSIPSTGVPPGAPSKCFCNPGFQVDVPVPFTGTIEIIKDVVPDSDTAGKFNLQIDGATQFADASDNDSTGAVTVSAGISTDPDPIGDTHTVGEVAGTNTDLANYISSISCVDQEGDTASADPGAGPLDVFVEPNDVWVCTITNERKPTLKLVKNVINDNGGSAVEDDWTLSADAATPNDGLNFSTLGGQGVFQTVFAGVGYVLSESAGPAGYTPGNSWSCSGGDLQGSTITLGPGENVTCTIDNDDNPSSLKLIKHVNNDNGGTADASAWTLSAGANSVTGSETAVEATDQAGTYALSETSVSGYTLTSLTCDDAPGTQVTSVTIGLGETKTCTFVNDDDAPSLKLIKHVINDNGGTADASAWTLSAGANSVTGSETAVEATNQAGTYALSETGPSGYTLTSLTCDDAPGTQVTSVTIGLGETKTCTFVNDDDAPSLKLIKHVINDNGGTADASAWTLSAGANSVTGSETAVEATDQAGTYALSETSVSGYTLTSLTCDDAPGTQVTSVTIGLGETKTCTFVNDDDAPSLKLIKHVNNDNGGTADASAWTLSAGANSVTGSETAVEATNQAGTYALSETGPSGYTLTSLTCDDAPGTQVTSVTIGLGETKTCTFVNDDDAPSLKLIKHVNNDNGGTADASAWTLSAGANSVTGSETAVEATDQAGTYALSETSVSGYTLTSLTCDDAPGTQVTSVTIDLGETKTCTFVNDDDAPSLKLIKHVNNDNGGTADASAWTLSAGANSVTGSETAVEATDQAGTYALSETSVSGYTLTSLTCDDAPGTQVTSVTIGLGETKTCTFVNDDDAPSLKLIKHVNNDNGGTADASAWTLSAGANSVTGSETAVEATDQAGTYALSETSVSGYTLTSLTCDDAPGTQVTSVTIGLGETKTCTFVNDDDAPSLKLIKHVNNDNGGTADASAWTLSAGANSVTGSETAVEATDQAGTYALSETSVSGYTLTSLTCDDAPGTQVTSVTIGLGETKTCTFVNDDIPPQLTLFKVVNNGIGDVGTAIPSDWTLIASGTTGFSGSDAGAGVASDVDFVAGSYDLSETGPAGYDASDWVCVGGSQDDADTITLGIGESANCTITNTSRGMVGVLKTASGQPPTGAQAFTFQLRQGASPTEVGTTLESQVANAANGGDITFATTLVPGSTYQLCEIVMPGWMTTLGDFVPDSFLPPDGVATNPNVDNSILCVNFTVEVGELQVFSVNNTPPPGGRALTIGFWKNWTSCDGAGNQDPVLDDTLIAAGGIIRLGTIAGPNFEVNNCEDAVALLDKRTIDTGKKSASDPAYNLASQLLAAKLNLAAQAGFCGEVLIAIDQADALLTAIGFDGTGSYGGKKNDVMTDAQEALANQLAGTLDDYNNNRLCSN